VANDLSCADLMASDRELAFPRSVIELLAGKMGQTVFGFPADVQARILRDEKPVEGRPGDTLPPADFAAAKTQIAKVVEGDPTAQDVVSHFMYPQVFEQFAAHQQRHGDVSVLPTPTFLYGMEAGEEIAIDIEPGKTLIIKFLTVGEPHADGTRGVFFELNGQPREVTVTDNSLVNEATIAAKADPNNPKHVGASMPGMVVVVAVQPGEKVARGQKLMTLEAMKMETTIGAETEATIAEVHATTGKHVDTGDLLITFE
jgi:pyruvate carboxylase